MPGQEKGEQTGKGQVASPWQQWGWLHIQLAKLADGLIEGGAEGRDGLGSEGKTGVSVTHGYLARG